MSDKVNSFLPAIDQSVKYFRTNEFTVKLKFNQDNLKLMFKKVSIIEKSKLQYGPLV